MQNYTVKLPDILKNSIIIYYENSKIYTKSGCVQMDAGRIISLNPLIFEQIQKEDKPDNNSLLGLMRSQFTTPTDNAIKTPQKE